MQYDPPWPYVMVPTFALPENCPGMTASRLATYVAVRSFCYRKTAANSGFNRCTASLATIGKRAGQSRATVERNLNWLEGRFLIYRVPQGYHRPNAIVPVNYPDGFQKMCMERGPKAAVEYEECDLEEQREAKWKENAEDAYQRGKAKGGNGTHTVTENDVSPVRPPHLTHETSPTSPVSKDPLMGETPITGFKKKSEEEKVNTASPDTPPVTPPYKPFSQIQGGNPETQPQDQALSEGGIEPPDRAFAEVLDQIAVRAGRRPFLGEEPGERRRRAGDGLRMLKARFPGPGAGDGNGK
jgi:hypothetical protein